ncbi:Armadillo-like helical [Artemisia annua]|uniref:Armadillo-like helical n=1 Tax=Artemisia annua TaxID=35608 RepID=A0A2U1M094_ARTAN|nr:Armadillo-like helical [Artemisia annua]
MVKAALKDELTSKKLVCLFSSANSGHAQASVCNIVATVHPEADGALAKNAWHLSQDVPVYQIIRKNKYK